MENTFGCLLYVSQSVRQANAGEWLSLCLSLPLRRMHHPGMIVVLLGLAAVAAEAASKPNILVIFADDMVGLL